MVTNRPLCALLEPTSDLSALKEEDSTQVVARSPLEEHQISPAQLRAQELRGFANRAEPTHSPTRKASFHGGRHFDAENLCIVDEDDHFGSSRGFDSELTVLLGMREPDVLERARHPNPPSLDPGVRQYCKGDTR